MAGKLLTSLRSASTSAASVSHEAKLGMMVITILFFAFCFLVYHKMDLHQRQLTQASISSSAETAAVVPLDAAANLASQNQRPAGDPLINGAVLDESFALRDAANSLGPTSAPATDTSFSEEFAFDEPTGAPVGVAQAPATDATIQTDEPRLTTIASLDSASVNSASNSAESMTVAASEPAFPISASTDSEADTPAFESLDGSATADQAIEGSADDSNDSEPMLEFGEPQASESSSERSAVALVSPTPEPTSESAFENRTEPERALELKPEPAADDSRLLAMAEPQEGSPFSGGFGDTDFGSSAGSVGRAPVTEEDDGFSGTPVADSTSQRPSDTLIAQNSSSPSTGYAAVTQPRSQAGRNSIRTAGGSGADGKFSLAAFNYQNNNSGPAPDDGSTFDSVVVQKSDNYSKISKRVYGTMRYFSALAVFNQHRIPEPKHMRPGMIVLTPAKEVLEERYPELFVDVQIRTLEPAAFLILDDGSPAYRVGERETLSEISARFLGRSSRWVEIFRLNQNIVTDPNKLKPGIILALPADAAEVRVVP